MNDPREIIGLFTHLQDFAVARTRGFLADQGLEASELKAGPVIIDEHARAHLTVNARIAPNPEPIVIKLFSAGVDDPPTTQ